MFGKSKSNYQKIQLEKEEKILYNNKAVKH